jgi:adenylate cyclase
MAGLMPSLNAQWRKEAEAAGRTFADVRIGIGLNSGSCCVGNLGSVRRFDYSAIGDEVNVASRYEGLSKHYGLTMVIGEATVERLSQPRTLELDLIRVKGRKRPTRIYTMLDSLNGDRALLERLAVPHSEFLNAYRGRQWDLACTTIETCRALKVAALDYFYHGYIERIADHRSNPLPDDWDGAYTALSK